MARRARSVVVAAATMGAQWKQKGREAAANAKGRVMTRLTREIMIAARDGADPSMNPRLRMAVEARARRCERSVLSRRSRPKILRQASCTSAVVCRE